MVRSFILLYLLLLPCCLVAQQGDSLLRVAESGTPQAKLAAYKTLAASLVTKNFTASVQYGGQGMTIARALKDTVAMAELHSIMGEAQYFKGNYDIAANHIFKAIHIFERYNNKKQLGNAFNAIAKLYRKTRDLDKADQYYDKAMHIFTQLRDTAGMEMISNESGVVYEYRGDYKEAIRRYSIAEQYAQATGNKAGMGYALNNISGSLLLQGKYAEAALYLQRALDIRKEIKDSFALAINYSDLGTLYDSMGRYPQAIAYLDSSNAIALLLQYPQLRSHNYRVLSAIARKQDNYRAAYNYYIQGDIINDTIFNKEKLAQVDELNARYQAEKKEQQIKLQQLEISRRNYVIIAIVIVCVMGVALGYSSYRRYKVKQQQRLQQAIIHQQQLATQAVLEAEENERQRIGHDLHDGVGQMMSAVKINLSTFRDGLLFADEQQRSRYDNLMALVDDSCKEVRSISHQMMPNALLKAGLASAIRDFLNRIDSSVIEVNLYTEGLNERLGTDTETVLYRAIQECVNNVIKHARAARLDIAIIKDEDGISATIEDNGRGFDTSQAGVFDGIGLKNIRARIEYLKGTVDFDSRSGQGTVVTINIPYSV